MAEGRRSRSQSNSPFRTSAGAAAGVGELVGVGSSHNCKSCHQGMGCDWNLEDLSGLYAASRYRRCERPVGHGIRWKLGMEVGVQPGAAADDSLR